MSWLRRLFGKDPAEILEAARRRLSDGDPARALELARKLERHRDLGVRGEAAALMQQARDALVARSLDRAGGAEKAGDVEDAADWIRAALQHLGQGIQRTELENRLENLEDRARRTDRPWTSDAQEEAEGMSEEVPEGAAEISLEDRYHMLVSMFDDRFAERWEGRSVEFQQAVVDLNEGDVSRALATLEDLAARHPGDPVLLFERGRARLLEEKWAGAREDFEAAWTTFGDQALDRAGSLSMPLLWAEAVLGQGDAGALLDRLREQAMPAAGNPDLTYLYAQALVQAARLEDARDLLLAARQRYPSRQDFPHALAELLADMEERQAAIRVLELAVAPSCASGSCSRPPLHPPSLRLLATLHLDAVEKGEGGSLQRVEDLLFWLNHGLGGRLQAADLRLVARYHQLAGDSEAAEEARRKAVELERRARQQADHHPTIPGGDPSQKNKEMPI